MAAPAETRRRGWRRFRASLATGTPLGRGHIEIALRVGTVLTIVVLWITITMTGLVHADTLPSPYDLVREAVDLQREGYSGSPLSAHVAISAIRAVTGLTAAVLVGLPIGLITGYNRVVNAVLAPVLAFLRPIPAIAFVPLVVLYFGIGEFAKIFVIFFTTTLYFIVNVSGAVANVNPSWIKVGRALGLSQGRLFWHVIVPGSAPGILTGLRVAVAVSWTLVVAAELVAAQQGLGFLIINAATFGRVVDVYIGILLIGLIGFALETLVSLFERRVLHWVGR